MHTSAGGRRALRSVVGLGLWLGLLLVFARVNDWASPMGVSADWAPVLVWSALAALAGLSSRSWPLALGCFLLPVVGAVLAFWGLVVAPLQAPRPSASGPFGRSPDEPAADRGRGPLTTH